MEQSNKNQQTITNQTYFKAAAKSDKEQKSLAAAKDPELLSQHIFSINTEAQFFFKRKDYESALKKLKQAELILQYVAQSCRNIKKDLILVVLNNLVCVSQMLWDLSSASDYLEGIIYNLSISAVAKSQYKLGQSNIMGSLLNDDEMPTFSENLSLAQYNLRYCAINSSLMKHNNALIAARKASQICLLQINGLQKQSRDISSFQKEEDRLIFEKVAVLKTCIEIRQLFNKPTKRQDFLNLVYSFWKRDCLKAKNKEVQSYFRTICLGDVMSFSFKSLERSKNIKECQQSPYYLFLLISISHFSIATQLKSINQTEYQKDITYFFFISIVTYMLLIPYQSPYLQFILNTYLSRGKSTLGNLDKVTFVDVRDFVRVEETGILPQESVTTPQIHRRKNLKLEQQNQKLKKIIQNNDFASKSKLVNVRSFDKKIKSLSNSRNQSKRQTQHGKNVQMLKSNNVSRKYQEQMYQQDSTNRKKKEPKAKKQHCHDKYDELGEKYFEMAFKKTNSPKVLVSTRKQSGNSQSSTKDQSGSEKVLRLSISKKEKHLACRRLKKK